MTNELVKDTLKDVSAFLNTKELQKKLNKTISASSNATWFDLVKTLTPTVVAAVENGKVELSGKEKANLATNIIMPLIKDKLPWYIKPFANTIIGKAIDIVVAALNKLFSNEWFDNLKDFLGKKKISIKN